MPYPGVEMPAQRFVGPRRGICVECVLRGFQSVGFSRKTHTIIPPTAKPLVERLRHTLCQLFSYLISDYQNNWDEMLLHVVAVHNNNVSRGTGLAPNEAHKGRYLYLPVSLLAGSCEKGHQSAKRDQLHYLELMQNRQVRAYILEREDRLIKATHQATNVNIDAIMNNRTKFKVSDWAWLYDNTSTITGGRKHVHKPTEGSSKQSHFVLISKLAHYSTGP